jgi:hypothetical protein
VRALFAELRRRARQHWGTRASQCGAVTFVQRFGSALNLNVHFHTLALDGVYTDDGSPGAAPRFAPLPPPPRGGGGTGLIGYLTEFWVIGCGKFAA